MADRYRTVLLFGAPGVGKGTQGALLGQLPGFHHFATGDMFRSLDPDSDLGREFHSYSSRGELVPNELTIRLWQENISARTVLGLYRPARDLLVLDGIPRCLAQASAMSERLDVLGIVHLAAPDIDAMVERMKGRALKQGRRDDADESVIRHRFEVYDEETAPVLGYYDPALINDVDAMGSPVGVLRRTLAVVSPIQASNFPNPLG